MNIIICPDDGMPLTDLTWITDGIKARGGSVTRTVGGDLVAHLPPTHSPMDLPAMRISAVVRAWRQESDHAR
jgi:hypothetical protein